MNLKIEPRGLPMEGLHLEGQLGAGVFDLPAGDPVKPLSPLALDIQVVRDDDDLIVTGKLSATFELTCSRCAEKFQQRLDLDPYDMAVPIENDGPIDLTAWL